MFKVMFVLLAVIQMMACQPEQFMGISQGVEQGNGYDYYINKKMQLSFRYQKNLQVYQRNNGYEVEVQGDHASLSFFYLKQIDDQEFNTFLELKNYIENKDPTGKWRETQFRGNSAIFKEIYTDQQEYADYYVYEKNGYLLNVKKEIFSNSRDKESINSIFRQVCSNLLDILVVLDRSKSMDYNADNVKINLLGLISKLETRSSKEWKLGIVSDLAQGENLLGFEKTQNFNYLTKDKTLVISDMLLNSGHGSEGASERPFLASVNILKKYSNFLRKDAPLELIIITDAKELSDWSVNDYLVHLEYVLRKTNSRVTVHGLLASKDHCPEYDTLKKYKSSKFKEAIELTGGAMFPLCDPSVGESLAELL